MKKTLLLILLMIFTFNINASASDVSYKSQNGTYYYLLDKGGFDVSLIDNKYVNGKKFSEIMNILFDKDYSYEVDSMGNITGKDILNAVRSRLSLPVSLIEDRHEHYTRAITFPTLFEMLDFYFSDILTLNNLKAEPGIITKNEDIYFLTYGEGKTMEYTLFDSFEVYDKRDVNVISDGDEVIEVIPIQTNISLSQLRDKKEVKGAFFLTYGGNLILKNEDTLSKFFITDSFQILRRTNYEITDREIILFVGNYKKNMNIAAIAVERMDFE